MASASIYRPGAIGYHETLSEVPNHRTGLATEMASSTD